MRFCKVFLRLWLFLPLQASVTVFWQAGFPATETAAPELGALERVLSGFDPQFLNVQQLSQGDRLDRSELLVLQYGSSFPADAWTSIHTYLENGGNLLVIGGEPLRIPVYASGAQFIPAAPEVRFARSLGIVHSYPAPGFEQRQVEWRSGYSFLGGIHVDSARYFVLEGRGLEGLAYALDERRDRQAAPVVFSDDLSIRPGRMSGARHVYLPFEANPGFWNSTPGVALVRAAATYAKAGAASFWFEMAYSTPLRDESPELVVHLREPNRDLPIGPAAGHATGEVVLELLSGSTTLERVKIPIPDSTLEQSARFGKSLAPGFYRIQGTYSSVSGPREFYENGFWVEDQRLLNSGPNLGVRGDFITRDGKPFYPFGTNYFSTEENGWDFSGPRNAAVWESDFAEMETHGVTFVRTGVWNGQFKFLDQAGGVPERFLRNVEAYLLCARRHNIAVNFTFFAFDPQTTLRLGESNPVAELPGKNPYLDPVTISAERSYVLSIVSRFNNVPFLCWDLINEPSFSNPRYLWHGNTPNGDPSELSAWRAWLERQYQRASDLASAWSILPSEMAGFVFADLPTESDLQFSLEAGQAGQARAYDYNLFAQDAFAEWAKTMVGAIRSTGSTQLIDVGQDEGGVTSRLLNQFFSQAGLSFTTNHSYRQNDDLLWDSLAAKVPNVPNIVGETGYQPIVLPNGEWRFDEVTGASLIERKWAAGFAGGTSGALSWD